MEVKFLTQIQIKELSNLEFNLKRKNLNLEQIQKLILHYKVK